MTRKAMGLVTSLLAVILLVLVSCAPAAPTEKEEVKEEVTGRKEVGTITGGEGITVTEGKEAVTEGKGTVAEEKVAAQEGMVKLTLTKLDGTVVEKWVEAPRYGGRFTFAELRDQKMLDPASGIDVTFPPLSLTNEALKTGDWYRSMQGTGEASFTDTLAPDEDVSSWGPGGAGLAESWEMVNIGTLRLNIRKGVFWQNKPPANGREMDAYDVVASWNYLWTGPRTFLASSVPRALHVESVEAPNKWTIIVKSKEPYLATLMQFYKGAIMLSFVYPRETLDQGNMKDWRNNLGSGAFMLTDYVADTSYTFVKNPNYWRNDPLHPQNRLPYVDGVKMMVIPDASTRVAALRTHKIDNLPSALSGALAASPEEAASLKRTNPELKYRQVQMARTPMAFWRTDKEPFSDIRVRQALLMAMNNEAIRCGFYDCSGSMIMEPIPDVSEFAYAYTPLEELSPLVQKLYGYHPEEAKQLLAEAGYPSGFKTSMLLGVTDVDLASVIAADWAKVGVELELNVQEAGTLASLQNARQYEMLMGGTAAGNPFTLSRINPLQTGFNWSMLDDMSLVDVVAKYNDLVYVQKLSRKERWARLKEHSEEFTNYYLGKAYTITFPGQKQTNFWQPYVKGYSGETAVGYWGIWKYMQYLWIDQELKREITGR